MSDKQIPLWWNIAEDYDPNDHLMNLKGKEYLDVQNRMLWFIKDQRRLTVEGLAVNPYSIRTEEVYHDHEKGEAAFKTTVRDVLGNEVTMYGSETRKDFGDYAEKASTKSLGRALAGLGYGTQFAPEMSEGERVVDSPVERKPQQQPPTPQRAPQQPAKPAKPAPREEFTYHLEGQDDPKPAPAKPQPATAKFLNVGLVRQKAAQQGITNSVHWQNFVGKVLGQPVADATLSQEQLQTLDAALSKRLQEAQAAARAS